MYSLSLRHRCSGSILSRRILFQTRWIAHRPRITTLNPSPPGTIDRSSDRSLTVKHKRVFGAWAAFLLCASAYLVYQFRTETSGKHDLSIFHRFEIVAKQDVSSTCSIFTLKSHTCPHHNLYRDAWQKGVWSVEIKQPQLQIARSYTPLPPPPPNGDGGDENGDDGDGSTELRFLIRREPHGEVSGYLHSLPVGADVQIRGLDLEYEIPSDVEDVLFIAGGTGIAPALQVAHSLLERRKSTGRLPKLHILWANRRREDAAGGESSTSTRAAAAQGTWSKIFWAAGQAARQRQHASPSSSLAPHHPAPIVSEINHLKQASQGKITLDYFIDEENSFITYDLLRTYLAAHSPHSQQPPAPTPTPTQSETQPQPQPPTPKGTPKPKNLLLISGPDGFIAHYAGPKIWAGGKKQAQGPLGGVLKRVLEGEWGSAASSDSFGDGDGDGVGNGNGGEGEGGWEVWKL